MANPHRTTREPLYRFYRLDRQGRINGVEVIEAAADADALARARALAQSLGGADFEVWDRGRPVLAQAACAVMVGG